LAEWLGLKQRKPRPRVDARYHAVSIIPGPNACAAVRRFASHRFFLQDAPRLPLPTCDAFHCECQFRHHQDRRGGARRRSDIGFLTGLYSGLERRQIGGRRKDDHDQS
jgi:hypothetical protein